MSNNSAIEIKQADQLRSDRKKSIVFLAGIGLNLSLIANSMGLSPSNLYAIINYDLDLANRIRKAQANLVIRDLLLLEDFINAGDKDMLKFSLTHRAGLKTQIDHRHVIEGEYLQPLETKDMTEMQLSEEVGEILAEQSKQKHTKKLMGRPKKNVARA